MNPLFKRVTIIVFGLIILLAIVSRTLEVREPLPILGTIPAFELTDSRGIPTGLADLEGHVWIADFIFTTCAGPCPIMSTNMASVHRDFIDENDLRLVSFTVNPDYDTPEILEAYAQRYNAQTDRWHFLTGAYEDIQSLVANGFKMGDMEEIVFHSTRFALVDREAQIRGYYIGTEVEEMDQLRKDLERLLRAQS